MIRNSNSSIFRPPCRDELRSYQNSGVAQKIQEAGGQIIGVSSQDNDEAQKAKEAWKIEYEIVGDPSSTTFQNWGLWYLNDPPFATPNNTAAIALN